MPNQFTDGDHEQADIDDSERLDEPVKVRWDGYARQRIYDYNLDFDDDGFEDHFMRPSIYTRTMERLKTRVVVTTVREANCVRYELRNYGDERTWVNSSIVKSLGRVARRLDEEMAERGYEPDFSESDQWGLRTFHGYEKA